jgi:hypothetical protein
MSVQPTDLESKARKTVLKLAAASVALLGLIGVWIIDRGGAFGAIAAVSTIVLAAPIELLLAIDAANALRAAGSRSARLGLPELILGGMACLGSVGGFSLVFFGNIKTLYFAYGCVVSSGLLLLGARWLHSGWKATRARPS